MQVAVKKRGSTGEKTGTKMKKIKQKCQKQTAKEEVILWVHDKEKKPECKGIYIVTYIVRRPGMYGNRNEFLSL